MVQLGAAAAVAFTARASLADHYRVPSGSMEPTVHVGDHIVVSKAAYGLRLPLTDTYRVHFGAPARGDVVVLEPPDDVTKAAMDADVIGSVLLKRVVAIEDDLVEVRDGPKGPSMILVPRITLGPLASTQVGRDAPSALRAEPPPSPSATVVLRTTTREES